MPGKARRSQTIGARSASGQWIQVSMPAYASSRASSVVTVPGSPSLQSQGEFEDEFP